MRIIMDIPAKQSLKATTFPGKSGITMENKMRRSNSLDEAIDKVAEGMEEQFAKFLINEMKKSAPKNEDDDNAMNIYESFMDDEHAKILAQNETLGVAKLVKEQLKQKVNPYASTNASTTTKR